MVRSKQNGLTDRFKRHLSFWKLAQQRDKEQPNPTIQTPNLHNYNTNPTIQTLARFSCHTWIFYIFLGKCCEIYLKDAVWRHLRNVRLIKI